MDGDGDSARLAALAEYDILDTPAEAGFDDIVRLAANACETPVALVSFVSFDRQWFKARVGFDGCETPLGQSVCSHVVSERRLLVIGDLTQDARTRDNPLVTGDPFIRFYAGAPLTTPLGETLGALCVIDSAPRPQGLSSPQIETLLALARQVMTQLELRRLLRENGTQREALSALNDTLSRQVAERTADRDRMWRLSTDVMLVAGMDGVIKAINPAWTSLLGWSEGELLGQNFLDLVHPDDVDATVAEMGRLGEGRTTFRFENRYRRKSGGYCVLSWMAVPDDGLLNGVGRDVTVEREADAARARLEELLRQSQKMEAVGQLTGGLAHDFNNLLTGITGSLEMLKRRVAQGRAAEVERYVDAAQGAAGRAAALTHRLLAFSRRQTLAPKPTDANRLIGELDDLVRRTIGPAVEMRVSAAPDLWTILVDPPQLENAILNLCINARDAMPDGGRLTLETANRQFDELEAQDHDLAPGAYVVLSVSDTGMGMAPEVAARAFDPFFTTKPLGEGTGLGLSMIHGFAVQSGGQVRIDSQPGFGTAMRLYLPRHLGEADAAAISQSLGSHDPAAGGAVVLVVDDEPTVRMLVMEVLADLGCRTLEAGDGAAGLALLQSEVRIDLMVTDVGLPGGMNGRQLADAARASRPDLKVLFITGYAETAVLGAGRLEPWMEVLTKPFAINALADKVRGVLDA